MGKRLIAEKQSSIIWNQNCLNTIRLIAAVSVMYGHVKLHLNVATPVFLDQLHYFFFGVPIFFSMSGFLLWSSAGRSSSFLEYGKKRFWRIYPELWCGVVVEILVMLVLFDQPIQWISLLLFAITQGTFLQFWTPDFLRSYGCGTPNGSLWTICVMIQFYIVIYFIYKLLHGKKLRNWIGMLMGFIVIAIISPYLSNYLPEIIYKLYNQSLFPYFWLFLLGAFVAEYRDSIVPFLKRHWGVFLLVSALLLILNWDVSSGPYGYGIFRCSALFAGLLGFAYQFPKFNVKRDISYGIYLYHMTVVNAMITLGYTQSIYWLLVAMVVSFILAVASEKIFSNFVIRKKPTLSR